uniref:S100/CaBP-9k-type calcium binding subdomain domain-containing protein n=1 Tax=Mola mola TaxID=94237 RepID=A0A3Q3VR61_MOLML
MSGIVPAMKLLRDVFDIYARKEGDSNTLSKKEVITLLQVMFPISDATNQAAQDKFFTNLENNRDVVVSFEEFVTFAATLSHLYVFSFFLCTYKLLTLD